MPRKRNSPSYLTLMADWEIQRLERIYQLNEPPIHQEAISCIKEDLEGLFCSLRRGGGRLLRRVGELVRLRG